MERETNGFVILNEQDLTIVQQVQPDDNEWKIKTEARVFWTEEDANDFASDRLEMWSVIHIHFKHKFIHHAVNQKEN